MSPHIELRVVEDGNVTSIIVHRDRIREVFDATPAGAEHPECAVWVTTLCTEAPYRALTVRESYIALRARLETSIPW